MDGTALDFLETLALANDARDARLGAADPCESREVEPRSGTSVDAIVGRELGRAMHVGGTEREAIQFTAHD